VSAHVPATSAVPTSTVTSGVFLAVSNSWLYSQLRSTRMLILYIAHKSIPHCEFVSFRFGMRLIRRSSTGGSPHDILSYPLFRFWAIPKFVSFSGG
jgi:hypothetical protein